MAWHPVELYVMELDGEGCTYSLKQLPLDSLDGEAKRALDKMIREAKNVVMVGNRIYMLKPKPEWAFENMEQPEIPDSIAGEAADFVDCIVNDTLPPVDVTDNLQTMAACFAVVESAAQGGHPVEVATWD